MVLMIASNDMDYFTIPTRRAISLPTRLIMIFFTIGTGIPSTHMTNISRAGAFKQNFQE